MTPVPKPPGMMQRLRERFRNKENFNNVKYVKQQFPTPQPVKTYLDSEYMDLRTMGSQKNVSRIGRSGTDPDGREFSNEIYVRPAKLPAEAIEPEGIIRSIAGNSPPPAGFDINEPIIIQVNPTFGAKSRAMLLNATFQLVTSSTVGNRNVRIQLVDDFGSLVYVYDVQSSAGTIFNIAASTTAKILLAQNIALSAITFTGPPITADASLPLVSPNFVRPGWRIQTVTTNIQSGDQWSAIRYTLQGWPEP
jgi:hypothetical protein